jgi:hypothetical protein
MDLVERARLAGEVLDNPVYVEAYTLLETEITNAWRRSKDKDEREELHRLLRMLEKSRTVLESAMAVGKVEAHEIRRKATLAERAGRMFQHA